MNFFFDNNISHRVTEALVILEPGKHHIIQHISKDKRFIHNNNEWGSNSTPDTEWIPALGKDNVIWNVISGDHGILTKDMERQLVVEAGLAFFYVDKHFCNCLFFEKARKLIYLWPEIVRHASAKVPGVFKIVTGPHLSWRVDAVLLGRESLKDITE